MILSHPLIWSFALEGFFVGVLAFLSGAEAAVLSANRMRAKHDAELGITGAKALVKLQGKKEDFLPVVLALQTFLTVGISAFGTAVVQTIHPGGRTLFFAALLLSAIVLFLGEILPKTLAAHKPNRFAYLASPLILFLTKTLAVFLHPVIWLLRKILKFFGSDFLAGVPTEKELKYFISLSREHGFLQKEEEEMLQNILDFADTKVQEIMLPRTRMESLDIGASLQEVVEKFSRTNYNRYPVHDKNLDHILGVVEIRDILPLFLKKEEVPDLKRFIRPVHFIPESKRVGKLLAQMQQEQFQFAVVVDEYGGTAGMVTLTDLLERIVGTVNERALAEEIQPLDDKNLLVPAGTKLEEIEEELGISFPTTEYQTIGGLVFGLFGRVPEKGEQIRYQKIKFTVTQKDGYKINQVMITKEAP